MCNLLCFLGGDIPMLLKSLKLKKKKLVYVMYVLGIKGKMYDLR